MWEKSSSWQQHTGRQPSCAGKTDAIAQTKPLTQRYPLRVGKTDWRGAFHSFSTRYPPARGEDPSRNAIRFPVTEVPVSTTVALHSKVLCSLHGRMSSGPPQPYFVEILRRGGNPAVGDEYFNRRVSLSFNIHLRYFLCVGKTASAYCSTNSTIVAVFFVYGKSSVDAVRFPSQEFPLRRPLPCETGPYVISTGV